MKKKPMLVKRRYEEGGSWVKHDPTTNSYEFSNSKPSNSSEWFWAEGRKLQNIKNNRSGSEGTVKGEYNYSSSRPNEIPYSIDQYGNYINKSTGQVMNVSSVKREDLGDKNTTQINNTKPGNVPTENPEITTEEIKRREISTPDKSKGTFNEGYRNAFNSYTSEDKGLGRKAGTILTKEQTKANMREFKEDINPIKKSNLWFNQCTGKHGCLAYAPPINILAQLPDAYAKIQQGIQRIGEDKKQRSLQAYRNLAGKAKQELVQGTNQSQLQYNTTDASGNVIPKFKLADEYGRKIEQYDPTTGKYDKMSGRQTKKFYQSQDPNFGKKK